MFFALAQAQEIKFKTEKTHNSPASLPQHPFHINHFTTGMTSAMALKYISAVLKWQFLGSAIPTQCLSMAKATAEDVSSTQILHKGLCDVTVTDRRRYRSKKCFHKSEVGDQFQHPLCQIDPFLGLCC